MRLIKIHKISTTGVAAAAAKHWWWSRWQCGFDVSQLSYRRVGLRAAQLDISALRRSRDLAKLETKRQQKRPHCNDHCRSTAPIAVSPCTSYKRHAGLLILPGGGSNGDLLQGPGSWCIRTSWPSSQGPEKLGLFQPGPVSTSTSPIATPISGG